MGFRQSEKRFNELWKELKKSRFECLNDSNPSNAFNEYLKTGTPIRFAVQGTFIPNFELKFARKDLNKYSLKNKVKVKVNNELIYISKMELQIAYKLYLGSDKDIEDAIHLWQTFKKHLNKELFNEFAKRLKVEGKVKELE